MLIISDSSPITNLIKVGQLDILKSIFISVIIPYKVYEELSVYEKQKEILDNCDWIIVIG